MKPLDLAVIGGGITGLGVARLAARNGLAVALFERRDLAAGATSASSHMLHGGLRYLEQMQFRLVREALAERAALLRMAPALAHPRRFLFPLHKGARVAPWKLKAGLFTYDLLAGPRLLSPRGWTGRRETLALEPGLAPEGLAGAGHYTDVVMDDARLAIAVARDAAAHGAAIHTWTEVTSVHPAEGGVEVEARDALTGAPVSAAAKVVVNATGPWTDATRRILARGLAPGAPDPEPLLRPSRGTHLVFPPLTRGHGIVHLARSDGRVVFLVPFDRWTLFGTTEVELDSPLPAGAARPAAAEVRYLREELASLMPVAAGAAPIAVFAGVRPLVGSSDAVGDTSREHLVRDEGEVLTVCGGKWTTFRLMARDALDAVARKLHRAEPIRDSDDVLPAPWAGAPDPEALAAFAVEHEMARRLEDVLRRRTLLWLEPDRGRVAAPRVAAVMAERLGWNEERTRDEIRAWESSLREEEALLRRVEEDA